MMRKNAVESVQAERNILISVRNPFVVSSRPLSCWGSALFATPLKVQLMDPSDLFPCLFQVRFFYSFTCKENLYLVMEYLSGGDLYSMLRNLGCLEEDMARTYIAELV